MHLGSDFWTFIAGFVVSAVSFFGAPWWSKRWESRSQARQAKRLERDAAHQAQLALTVARCQDPVYLAVTLSGYQQRSIALIYRSLNAVVMHGVLAVLTALAPLGESIRILIPTGVVLMLLLLLFQSLNEFERIQVEWHELTDALRAPSSSEPESGSAADE